MINITYKEIPVSDLYKIKSLWEGLNQVHLEESVHFTEHYKHFTFEKRAARWKALTKEDILILVVENDEKSLLGTVSLP
jgi:diamine N-acetyltransferase